MDNNQHPSLQDSVRAIYQCADTIFVRIPLMSYWPFVSQEQIFVNSESSEAVLDAARHDARFLEALALASPPSIRAVEGEISKASRAVRSAATVRKYASRMASRPTPFGLFAGVAVGRLDVASKVDISPATQYRTYTRLDNGWLTEIVKDLERDPNVFSLLAVQRNPLLIVRGDRAILTFAADQATPAESSIRCGAVARAVFERSQNPVSVQDLATELSSHLHADVNKVMDFLRNLAEARFLITDLRPPLWTDDPVEWLDTKLSTVEGASRVRDIRHTFQSLRRQLNRYDYTPLERRRVVREECCAYMQGHAHNDTPLQVDLTYQGDIRLSESVGREVAQAAEMIWRISPVEHGVPQLRPYHREFLERYGIDVRVGILDVLDDAAGLGPPPGYRHPASTRQWAETNRRFDPERDRFLLDRYAAAMASGDTEILLSDDDIGRLSHGEADTALAPLGFEVCAQLVAATPEALDAGQFLLVPTSRVIHPVLGGAISRFGYALQNHLQEHQQLVQRLAATEPDVVHADLVVEPRDPRTGNIARGQLWHDRQIVIGRQATELPKDHVISLDDLAVGATRDQLYLWSISANRRVIAHPNTMLNLDNDTNVARLCADLAKEGVRWPVGFDWGPLAHATYKPRVRWSRTVLSPATWRLPRDFGKWTDDDMAAWFRRWRIPRHVLLVHKGQQLLVDLENHYDRRILRTTSSSPIVLREALGLERDSWLSGSDGPRVAECVFALYRSNPRSHMSENLVSSRAIQSHEFPSPPACVVYRPGSEWLYAKLYSPVGLHAELLSGPLHTFITQQLKAFAVDRWFFVRYADPDPHLRLRLHGDAETLRNIVIPALAEWTDKLVAEHLARVLLFDSYQPEWGRYGGEAVMASAENVFEADSALTLLLLKNAPADLSLPQLAALGILDIARGLLGEQSLLSWADRHGAPEPHDRSSASTRRRVATLSIPSRDSELMSMLDSQELRAAWHRRRQSVAEYARALRLSSMDVRQMGEIGSSVAHMHCNRLLGLAPDRESYARGLVRYAARAHASPHPPHHNVMPASTPPLASTK